MFQRVIRVFRLQASVFEEVEHDNAATVQAALVVLIAGILTGLGGAFAALFNEQAVLGTLLGSIIWTLIVWLLWSLIAYLVGVYLFKGQADVGEMLRTIGFGMAPLWLAVIPCLGGIIGSVWTFAAILIALRQGLDVNFTKAVLTAIVGVILFIIGNAIFYSLSWGNLFF
jgi:hypothetical protein